MFLKEGNDDLVQVLNPADAEGHAFPVIRSDYSATEESLQREEQPNIPSVLNDGEFRKHLILADHIRVRVDADEETSFAINESHNPVSIELHRSGLNVKSLRVLHFVEPSLRIVPMSAGF